MMTMTDFLDQFIDGEKGYYYFDFEVGHTHIMGGAFYKKQDAREILLDKINRFLLTGSPNIDIVKTNNPTSG